MTRTGRSYTSWIFNHDLDLNFDLLHQNVRILILWYLVVLKLGPTEQLIFVYPNMAIPTDSFQIVNFSNFHDWVILNCSWVIHFERVIHFANRERASHSRVSHFVNRERASHSRVSHFANRERASHSRVSHFGLRVIHERLMKKMSRSQVCLGVKLPKPRISDKKKM